MYYVIIDTTCIKQIKGRLLGGPDVDLLRNGIEKLGIKLFVPRVVVDEATNQYKKDLLDRVKNYHDGVRKLQGYLPLAGARQFEDDEVNIAIAGYRDCLIARLGELGATLLDHTNIPHDATLERAIAKRKPFDDNGRGYQDALIWESILTIVDKSGPKIIFVTDNINDFCDKDKSSLHQHLIEYLKVRGFAAESVSICRSITDFNKGHVVPHMDQASPSGSTNKDDWTYEGFSMSSFFEKESVEIADHIRELLRDAGDDLAQSLRANVDVSGVYLSNLYEPHDIVADTVVRIDDRIAAIIHVRAVADLHFDIHKSDQFTLHPSGEVYIIDSHLNSHMMTMGVQLEVDIMFDVTLESKSGEMQEYIIANLDLL